MIIILEGPDNAGKSTLARRLSADLNLEVVHPGGPPKNISDAISRCVEQEFVFEIATQVNFIYDRITCISDMIYRGKPQYHNIFYKFQDEIKRHKNVLIVYCRPSLKRLRNFDDHVMQEHEDAAVVQHAKDNVDRIITEYDAVMKSFEEDDLFEFVRYDFELDEYSSEYSSLKSIIYNKLDNV